ncbi:hypothetical protein ACO1KB_12450 [Leptospira interrogans serovar Szwajizak]|uniref:hypothetical protein n=1 Tax=Leptospira interrogans TaxID=173 RepID=UPI00037665F1|nr:hypothetical protein [Leptospira interrogans]
MPQPPSQQLPWTAPDTKLLKKLTNVVPVLFEQGLADPRGLEYRSIVVRVGSVWGNSHTIQTRGWVIDSFYAIGWNGLVYPVISIGEKQNLRSDILSIVSKDKKERAEYEKKYPGETINRSRYSYSAFSEDRALSEKSLLPLKVALLLRLNEVELAETLWKSLDQLDTDENETSFKDPYLLLIQDLVWAYFDRAVCAHMRGDTSIAFTSASILSKLQKAVDLEAKKRGFQESIRLIHHVLASLPELLSDEERRLNTPRNKDVSTLLNELSDDPIVKTKALIELLDEISARQFGQPGGVYLGDDPILKELIRVGEPAVELLLTCLEEDSRLTRSVSFHRDFFRTRRFISVSEAAYIALCEILQIHNFGKEDDWKGRGVEGQAEIAAKIRAYWNKYKGMPYSERLYKILADDQVGGESWLEAASSIVQTAGKSLRGKNSPSVSTLMRERVKNLLAAEEFDSSCDMVLILADWDLQAALPLLRRRYQEIMKSPEYKSFYIVEITKKRVQAKDLNALPEYALWLDKVNPEELRSSIKEPISLLWENPTHPSMIEAGRKIFLQNSSWRSYLERDRIIENLIEVELSKKGPLLFAPFREYLLQKLSDKKDFGTVTLKKDGELEILIDMRKIGTRFDINDPLAPAEGTRFKFRVCDYYAWYFVRELKGWAQFMLYWPEITRDQTIEKIKTKLKTLYK